MYISEIQQRLMNIVGRNPFDRVLGYVLSYGASRNEMTDAYHVALWIEGAPTAVKRGFLDTFDQDHAITVCDYCGKFMTEGFMVFDDPYCSEECAIASYRRDVYDADLNGQMIPEEKAVSMFEHDRAACPEEVFWTQWY